MHMVRKSRALAAVALFGAATVVAQTARLQVIHNAADPAAETVDVYVNGGRLLDDFKFRAATAFIDVLAGVPLDIGIAPGSSMSAQDTLKNFVVTFAAGKKYVAIANGVVTPGGFSANPDGRSIALSLYAKDGMREKAVLPWLTDVAVFHGATDAPTVDVVVRGLPNPLVNDLSYGRFSTYRSLLPKAYTIDVTPGNDNRIIVASFRADLSGLRGGAAVVFASGFLNPAANQNGNSFGLFAALPNGTVIELPALGTARLQVIHNAADPLAANVDVYINGDRALDDFQFRSATPFIDVPAGVPLNIGIAPGGSTSVLDTIKNFEVTLTAGKRYVAIANGVVSGTFAPNPDGKNIGLALFPRDGMREKALVKFLVDFLVFHGATDAPTVDVRVRGLWFPLVDDLSYGAFSGYRSVFPLSYTLEVTPGNSRTVVAAFKADLSGLKGGAAVIFASGFLTPAANQNGPAFGLFAALPNGQVVELPAAGGAANEPATASLAKAGADVPGEFSLSQNYPNPFNPTTTITYALPSPQVVSLKVYNSMGQEVAVLENGMKDAGSFSVVFDAKDLASGVYFYRLQAGNFVDTKKLTVLK